MTCTSTYDVSIIETDIFIIDKYKNSLPPELYPHYHLHCPSDCQCHFSVKKEQNFVAVT